MPRAMAAIGKIVALLPDDGLYQPPLMLTHEEWVNGGWYES